MRLLHIFWGSDLRGRQPSLLKAAKKAGLTLENLKPGDILCFVNTRKNKLATITRTSEVESQGVLGYYKSPHHRSISPRALKYIPESFGMQGEINMDKTLRLSLLEQLRIRE